MWHFRSDRHPQTPVSRSSRHILSKPLLTLVRGLRSPCYLLARLPSFKGTIT
ncbi:MAG TPA: hypothetical protein V6C71_11685 [Coleofasciculaceae cyanobacterium]